MGNSTSPMFQNWCRPAALVPFSLSCGGCVTTNGCCDAVAVRHLHSPLWDFEGAQTWRGFSCFKDLFVLGNNHWEFRVQGEDKDQYTGWHHPAWFDRPTFCCKNLEISFTTYYTRWRLHFWWDHLGPVWRRIQTSQTKHQPCQIWASATCYAAYWSVSGFFA